MDDVLAAGDCAEVINAVSGEHAIYAVAVVANRQGRYIAEHLLGNKMPYGPVICPTVTVVGDLLVGSVGLTTRACEMAGIAPVSHKAKSFTKARYYPGGKPIDVKLISDGERIIGGQVIGEEDVGGRINLLAMGIHKKITVHELADSETCYAPPVSPVIDPLTYTAETLELKCKRIKMKEENRALPK
jgi:NADH oxidase (H2O2-forming)